MPFSYDSNRFFVSWSVFETKTGDMDLRKDNLFELAERLVENTGTSLFLTGKAGTGKTTFLKYITENTSKRFVILAPTGVAAINAGGTTIHSFFQLPLCPYLPDIKELVTEYQMPERFRSLRKERIKIIRTLDLLIIDEISMVRADLLDAVDMSLRRYRRSDKPFGGVQLLMVGDIRQLSPVVTDNERPYINRVYSSPYFFSSKALKSLEYVTIELETVYRQEDQTFVEILNAIRDGHPSDEMLRKLNSRVGADISSGEKSEPIRLMTHNRRVDSFNTGRLDTLPGAAVSFTAEIEGEFPESSYPTDGTIYLKEGAQVMFIRNDTSGAGEYYNGKIGKISSIGPDDNVTVECENGRKISVSPVEWENIQYALDKDSGEIRQEKIGTFRQIPLRPAWAITIHKSQGLTFDRVIIDANAAFAFGQVYVALSRCRTLEGISLDTPVRLSSLFSDQDVSLFTSSLPQPQAVRESLSGFETAHYAHQLCSVFDFSTVGRYLGWMDKIWQDNLDDIYPERGRKISECIHDLDEILPVTEKFRKQINLICGRSASVTEDGHLLERIRKASGYFIPILEKIRSIVTGVTSLEIDNRDVKKKIKEASGELLTQLGILLSTMEMIQSEGFSVRKYAAIRTGCLLEDRGRTAKKAGAAIKEVPKQVIPEHQEEGEPNAELVARLRQWRAERYMADGVPAFFILHQQTLMQIAAVNPQTEEELLSVRGFGKAKFAKYGEEILSICKEFSKDIQ